MIDGNHESLKLWFLKMTKFCNVLFFYTILFRKYELMCCFFIKNFNLLLN